MIESKYSLGDRMKGYEFSFRHILTDNMDYIIRLDGRHFHTLTRNMDKPFDLVFIDIMREVAKHLLSEIQGAKIVYVQSDEISVYLTNKNKLEAESYFNNNLQKIVSVSASFTTMKFNELCLNKFNKLGMFDSRIFMLPSNEIANYFIWRQRDWNKNSIQMVARSLYSQKKLDGFNGLQMKEMILEKGQNYDDLEDYLKNGSFFMKKNSEIIEINNKVNYDEMNQLINETLVGDEG